jgi:hypothetical protein
MLGKEGTEISALAPAPADSSTSDVGPGLPEVDKEVSVPNLDSSGDFPGIQAVVDMTSKTSRAESSGRTIGLHE